MNENIEYRGEWFLPSAKNKRINGILTYDTNEGSSLDLFGSFDEKSFIPIMKNEDIIQGITSDSKQITLYRCFMSKTGGGKSMQGEESGIPTTNYMVGYILEGAHINYPEEINFHKITSEIYNLDEWVGISGFATQKMGLEDIIKKEIDVHYKLPDPIKFVINDKLEGQFNFIVNHPGWSRFQKNISLNQRVELIISSESECSLETLLKYLFEFQNFLILALYNRTTYPNNIALYSNNIVKDYGNGKPVRKRIELYFPISNRSKVVKPKLDIEMLFDYKHIREEFPVIIKNWFNKYELLEPAFNLLFEQFYNNDRFSTNTFLNLAQAAETFHARTHNHTRMPKKDFNKMKDDIYASVSKDYYDWLKDQFNFGNNLNLHNRLTEIVAKYSNDILDKIIGNKELFVKQVKWSRNYYTHYSSSGKKQALKGPDLFYLTEKLKIVLVCSFLVEVGFDNEKLTKLLELSKYKLFNHLAKW
jgi:hypothetical protein